ncbi:MAG: exo-alpha-sialidase [Ignavibacteriae bacterium]|nr:exo-alpha-sialidase [Ignavibacteriota bacterium]
MLIAFDCPSERSFAQGSTCDVVWDSTIQISQDSVLSIIPQIAVTGDTVHLLWFGFDTLGTITNDGILYSRSFNGGQSFSQQKVLSSADTVVNPGLIAAQQGYVYVVFSAVIDTFYGTAVTVSSDAGVNWTEVTPLRPNAFPRVIVAQDSNVYLHYYDQVTRSYGLVRSSDYGMTWSSNTTNTPPFTDVLPASDTLHAVGPVEGSFRKEVAYYFSTSFGRTWSFPEVLSQEDLAASLYPQLAADRRGKLYVAWNDTGSIVMRRSRNNGRSWIPEIKISQENKALFLDLAADNEFVTVVWESTLGGAAGIRLRSSNDFAASFCPIALPTTNTTATGPTLTIVNTQLHLVWSEEVNGHFEILYRRGTLIENPDIIERPPKAFALKQNYPNPFNGITRIRYDIPETTYVQLTIYNILGQAVSRLVNEVKLPGRYEALFSGSNFPTGVYFYQVRTTQFIETRKLVILR